jgi:hypothetical protein
MTVTETLGGLGSWSVKLSDECPDEKSCSSSASSGTS